MEDSPRLYVSKFGDSKDPEEGDDEDVYQEAMDTEPNAMKSLYTEPNEGSLQDTQRDRNSFPCRHCERHFTCKQGLERHMHTHTHASPADDDEARARRSSKGNTSSSSTVSQLRHETIITLDSEGSVTTHTNKRRHECKVHEQHPQPDKHDPPQVENTQRTFSETSQHKAELGDKTAPAVFTVNEGEHVEQYMLDVSSNISENLSFYIGGKIVSTSTVSSCEAAEGHPGTSTLVRLDTLILDPGQMGQVLNTDVATCREIPGQPLAKRRTATPPLLPQIKTELESEVVVSSSSSSSSSLVTSLIENLLPQNAESTVVQKERTVFLSPKLQQFLEKKDVLEPALALITDGQKPCSPASHSLLPAARFKRRTGSPTRSPQPNPTSTEERPTPDTADPDAGSTGETETQRSSPTQQTASENDETTQPAEEQTENWPPMKGGNPCNQQPLDLSNTLKRCDDVALSDAALDLSFQKNTMSMVEKALMDIGEQNVILTNPNTSLVTDFTMVTGPDMMNPLEPVAEGLVYGLALSSSSLTPSTSSLTPVTLQSAPPCTIAFASPASHTVLPAAPSLITFLASPPPPSPHPSSQPIQVLAPNLTPEPLVICTETALNHSQCDLTNAFASANTANLVTFSQPFDPTLNLPGHVFLTEQIALNPPLVESGAMSEVPFTPTLTLNDSLMNSYNITSNTVLIECTIALEAPGGVVPAAITLQENTAEPPATSQIVVNHMEQQQQQQIVSVPNPQTVDTAVLVSSVAEPVSLPTTTLNISDCSAGGDSNPDPESAVDTQPSTSKEEEAADAAVPTPPETQTQPSLLSEKSEEGDSSNDTQSDAQHQQTFTKNFICNVCDKLFHSMKELGHHVGDHADEWPYKCEFCVLLFGKPSDLLGHRSSLHGVGKTYVCSKCTKEFVYLSNLKQHQEELHPSQQCAYTEEEKGKLRPQNYNISTKVETKASGSDVPEEPKTLVKKEEEEMDVAAEELFTTIKILASDGGKIKGPDVRLGINQHYPSFKPPPFPYHNRSPIGSVASATNFTTHNIPQTFTTAIRCTKCGKSFDNMPELHKHILACANASDKRRYTPKKNPIPLRHFAKSQNGVLSTTNSTNGLNASNRHSQSNRSKPNQESPVKVTLKVLNKRKKKLVQRVLPQRNKSVPSSNKMSSSRAEEQQETFVCPHCSREFTMRRSRTKHMAVCPKKPKEVKKRKEGVISVTKENDGHLHRGAEEKKQASPPHKTRLQTSGPAKRPAILPVQTVFSNKRSKIIIKESMQPKQEAPSLNDLPIGRTFNPAMRQYGRVQHNVKGIPIKISIVKPQQAVPQKDAPPPPTQSREQASGVLSNNSEHSHTA